MCDQDVEIPVDHEEILTDSALNRMSEMIKDGYTSGELIESIFNGSEELTYSGWWNI